MHNHNPEAKSGNTNTQAFNPKGKQEYNGCTCRSPGSRNLRYSSALRASLQIRSGGILDKSQRHYQGVIFPDAPLHIHMYDCINIKHVLIADAEYILNTFWITSPRSKDFPNLHISRKETLQRPKDLSSAGNFSFASTHAVSMLIYSKRKFWKILQPSSLFNSFFSLASKGRSRSNGKLLHIKYIDKWG
jgi:hypothetical protein